MVDLFPFSKPEADVRVSYSPGSHVTDDLALPHAFAHSDGALGHMEVLRFVVELWRILTYLPLPLV